MEKNYMQIPREKAGKH